MRIALATSALIAGSLGAAPLPDTVDLSTLTPAQGMQIIGRQAGDEIGSAVASAGDWNSDGLPDLVIGSPFARDPVSSQVTGLAHVVFGTASPPATLSLGALGTMGTEIRGAANGDRLGAAVAGLGDWNGDGLDDIAVGVPFAAPGGSTERGRVWILFGRANPPLQIDLTALAASEGVVIEGAALGDQTGFAVAGAGDWNADGLPDLAVGAPNADFGAIDAGRAYAIFGTLAPPVTIELALLSSAQGTIIDGASDSGTVPPINLFGDSAGFDLAGGHDLTGDGVDDLLVNAPAADSPAPNAGITYLIAGAPTPEAVIDLELPNAGVIRITGVAEDDQAFLLQTPDVNALFGGNVASPGDVDGDGRADLAVGSEFADPSGDESGEVYLILGRDGYPDPFPLATNSTARIQGESPGDLTGRSLARGDFNADGRADLAVAAPQANPLGRADAGRVTLLFGSPLLTGVFTLPDTQGFGVNVLGDLDGDLLGLSAAGVGDWNGDGFEEIALGAPGAGAAVGLSGAGVVYIVFGGAFDVPLPTAVGVWALYR